MHINFYNYRGFFERNSIYLFSLIVSALFLLICTKSSPLYLTNDWTDANASFSLGKSMMNGKVLYKDIFNQKGPLLYSIHGLSYLISNKTFLGVFFFELAFFSVFLLYSYKIARLYLNKRYGLILIPVITFLILNNKNFAHGDSPEQFGMTFLMISLYYLLKQLKSTTFSPIALNVVLLNGILAGSIIWMKYSMFGFWIGWILVISVITISNKKFLHGILINLVFFVGILLSTIPFIIYFSINGALNDWIESYVFVNINQYSKSSTIYKSIKFIIKKSIDGLGRNTFFLIISVFGILAILISNFYAKNIAKRIAILIPFLLLTIGVYGGGRAYIYYFLIISPVSIFGVIYILSSTKRIMTNTIISKNNFSYFLISLTLILFFTTIKNNHNVNMIKYEKNDLVQFSFAEIINRTSNPTLLNYGDLDIGLYTTTGIVPNIKFFQKQNIEYNRFPVNMDEQNRYLEEKLVEFVVAKELVNGPKKSPNKNEYFKNYELVAQRIQSYEGEYFTYELYKLK